jgi:diaminopimelate epimerase
MQPKTVKRLQPWVKICGAGRPFVKMHGLRNHFAIFDGRDTRYQPPVSEIQRICDAHTGIGAEQLVVIEKPRAQGRAAGAYAFMRLYNIDGREVNACGNATRCVAHILLEETGQDSVRIETGAGMLDCERAGKLSVRVNMGRIKTGWVDIPIAEALDTLHVPLESGPLRDGVASNIGNPHVTFFVDDLDQVDMTRYAPPIQSHDLFPESINVGAAQITGKDSLRLVVWERPGILTQACGSGACVAAYAARVRGLIAVSRVTVSLPAGALFIELQQDGSAVMTGPVEFCCQGTA